MARVLLSALLGGLLVAFPAIAGEQKASVASGQEIELDGYFFFNGRTCTSRPGVATLVKKPSHGTVTFKLVSSKIDKQFVEDNNPGVCDGKSVKSRSPVYKSNPGYKGPDSFKVRFSGDIGRESWSTPVTETYILTVR